MERPNLSLQQKMAVAARILAKQGHGGTLSGQITARDECPDTGELRMWTQPYGVPLELLVETDFVQINEELEVTHGSGFPNLATRFHLHVYRNRPDIKCAVHTHAPWCSALAMTGHTLHIGHMDTMALYDDVAHLPQWPGVPFGDEEGEIISGALGDDKCSVLAAHHGLFVGGRTMEEATYRAFFFEHAAQMQMRAMAAVPGQPLPEVDRDTALRARDWRLNEGPVAAHFDSWMRQLEAEGRSPLS